MLEILSSASAVFHGRTMGSIPSLFSGICEFVESGRVKRKWISRRFGEKP
jgi:hypothetical protein